MIRELGLDLTRKYLTAKGWDVCEASREPDADGFDMVARDDYGDLHFIDIHTFKADGFDGFKPSPPDVADVERRLFEQMGKHGDALIAYDRVMITLAPEQRAMLRHDVNALAGL